MTAASARRFLLTRATSAWWPKFAKSSKTKVSKISLKFSSYFLKYSDYEEHRLHNRYIWVEEDYPRRLYSIQELWWHPEVLLSLSKGYLETRRVKDLYLLLQVREARYVQRRVGAVDGAIASGDCTSTQSEWDGDQGWWIYWKKIAADWCIWSRARDEEDPSPVRSWSESLNSSTRAGWCTN